jgi:hypothetical protein
LATASSMASQTAPKVGSVSMADLSTTQSAKDTTGYMLISDVVSTSDDATVGVAVIELIGELKLDADTGSEIASVYPVVSPQPIGPSSASSTGSMNFLDSSSARTCTCTVRAELESKKFMLPVLDALDGPIG